jgi:hypothetical protein
VEDEIVFDILNNNILNIMNYLTFHDEEEKKEAPDNGRGEIIDGVAHNGEQHQIKLDEHLKLMMARHIIMKQLNQTP